MRCTAGMTEMNRCPRCVDVGLHVGEARSLHPRACGSCGGVWLAAEEATRVLRPLFVPGGLPGRPSPRRCPICAEGMTEWSVGATGVELDSCGQHGTWFDRSELEQLAVAAAELRGVPRPDFSKLHAREAGAAAVAGAAVAIAVTAVSSADLTHALAQLPAGPASTGDAAVAVAANADVVVGAVDVTVSALQLVGEGGVEVAAEAAGAGVEAAGGLLEALLEFVAGLFT